MKKTIILASLFCVSIISNSQSKSDSAKKDTVNHNHIDTYRISGKISDFQLLYKVVSDPGNVTPNQVAYIKNWLENSIKPEEDKKNNK